MKTEKDFQRIRILSLFLDRSTLRKQLLILITQVDDSGHRILQERCGKVTVSCRKAPEIAGTWKQYSRRKIFGFSSGGFLPTSCAFRQELGGKHRKKSENFPAGILPTFCAFRQELGGKHRKKSENSPAGILLPKHYRNYPEPAVFGTDSSTWVYFPVIFSN